MVRKKGDKMILISLHVPQRMFEKLDELVKSGIFPSRSEAIRHALRELLLAYNGLEERKPQEKAEEKAGKDLPEEMEKMILGGR